MDRQSGSADSWFGEVLRHAGMDPGRIASARSKRRPVVERSNPWKDPEGITEAGPILEATLAGGDGAGRILFVTDVEDDPIARVQAGVQLSRAAVARGLDVLLVDSDIRHVGLSRWLPDRDLDAEGLVDVLQYGASVAASRRPSEIDGIDVLGVGSYRPDASGIFGDEDLRRLHAQLRVGAGLVVVVGPARLDDRHFHPLAARADAVVLSMHMDASLGMPLGEFLAHLAACDRPVSGVFAWAGPDDSEKFVDDALLERSRVLPRATADSPFPGRGAGAAAPDETGADASAGADEDAPATSPMPAAPSPSPEPAPAPVEDDGPQSVRIRTERPRPGGRGGRGTSGVVRGLLIAMAVVILGFVGWWIVTWKSVEPTRPPVRQTEPVATQPPAEDVAQAGVEVEADASATDPGDANQPPAQPETAGETATPMDDRTEPVETARGADELLAQPVETGGGDVPAPVEEDPFEAGLRREGAAGWGLHLLSTTDETEAATSRARYARQGYSAVVREATVKGQLWYRVLLGDFATKAEASRFREQAQEKFRVDWVGVVKK